MSLTDPVARYVCEAAPLHDLLRRGLIQLSGFLLKRTIASQSAFIDYEPVEAARERIHEAADGLRSVRAPADAIHHRSHPGRCACRVGRPALAAAQVQDRQEWRRSVSTSFRRPSGIFGLSGTRRLDSRPSISDRRAVQCMMPALPSKRGLPDNKATNRRGA